MKTFHLALILLPLIAQAQLILPESPRVMGMAGAYTAVADDPQAGIRNPAALRMLKKIGTDLTIDNSAGGGPDHLAWAVCNPGTEMGTAIAFGVWSQGLLAHQDRTFYVPYAGTGWSLARWAGIGLVTRFPYLSTRISGESSRWEAVADLTTRVSISTLDIGAAVERCFGGAFFVARQLHAGAAWKTSQGLIVSYEWRAAETTKRFDFHYLSSHWGTELPIGKYFALRAGHTRAGGLRYSAGFALGLLRAGWRIESACDLPASKHGTARWAAGLGYGQ